MSTDYEKYEKYPRTPHLPWSPGATSDDVYLADVSHFEGREVVVTEKMDGENFTLYHDHCHARSIDSRHHPSRDWIKRKHGEICHQIPEDLRICGENLYAEHSIRYEDLPSYYMVFSVWNNEENYALSWDDTLEWCDLLGLEHVPVLYRGEWDEDRIRALTDDGEIDTDQQEGYVVRVTDEFHYDEFGQSLAKWVRPNHVTTSDHWMHQEVVPNELDEE